MIDQDKTKAAVIRTVPGHGELTQEEQEQIAELIDWALERDGKTRSCNKPCIANVGGQCAVEDCGGAIVQMHMGQNRTLEISARYYQYMRAAFDDYFGEGYTDDDTDE